MTSFEKSITRIEKIPFKKETVSTWVDKDGLHQDWPVVYLLNNDRQVYIGESTKARNRLKQHLDDTSKRDLKVTRIILNPEFNKSACLDLESQLIAWFHADNIFKPINRNDGQQNSNYFERASRYQPLIDEIFEQLRAAKMFSRTAPEIENLNIFKLSPFKALNDEQLIAVDGILDGLFEDIGGSGASTSVIQGGPGTGKTIVAIYLLKLLCDIQATQKDPDPEEDGRFSDFFYSGYREKLQGLKIGFVIPQQSLRKTIQRVFSRTPGLSKAKVLSPYTVANSDDHWDLLLIDEGHRLTHRGSGATIGQFQQRNKKLFGEKAIGKTAIDWMVEKSNHQIFLIDGDQTVRPADVPSSVIEQLKEESRKDNRFYSLESQMRVAAGEQYLQFARSFLSNEPMPAKVLACYDLRFFGDLSTMEVEIKERESETGLARLVAGYAWPWQSKNDKTDAAPFDIEIDGVSLRWNRTDTDWIASKTSHEEVGSVHTVQGYDLNYAGVIIGPDVIWDQETETIRAVKNQHFDSEVKRVKDDEELLEYIRNSYYVLMTRGMRGTYVYVHDSALRQRLKSLFSANQIQ